MSLKVSVVDAFAEKLTFFTASYLAAFVFLFWLVQLFARGGPPSLSYEVLSLCGGTGVTFCAAWAAGTLAWRTLKRRLQGNAADHSA